MKITNTGSKDLVRFGNLKVGEVFRSLGEGYVYLKINGVDIETDDEGIVSFNAVDISNNEILAFAESESVIPINAELVLS